MTASLEIAPYFDLLSEIPSAVRRSATPKVSANFGSKVEKHSTNRKVDPPLDGARVTANRK
jgi:hypothetical protein